MRATYVLLIQSYEGIVLLIHIQILHQTIAEEIIEAPDSRLELQHQMNYFQGEQNSRSLLYAALRKQGRCCSSRVPSSSVMLWDNQRIITQKQCSQAMTLNRGSTVQMRRH